MPANYVLLEKVVVGAAGAAGITFSNIPQTGYTDLLVVASARNNRTAQKYSQLRAQFNNDTGNNYTDKLLYSIAGATAGSTGSTSQTFLSRILYMPTADITANIFGNAQMYIPNYTSSNAKSLSTDTVMENNATDNGVMGIAAGFWNNTAAITSIYLFSDQDSLIQYSTFYLYGIAKLNTTPAIVPYATGGDTIMTDGTYWYHAFTASGTFTPSKGLSCDVLVVAGGGGGNTVSGVGSSNRGGGGGAGGLLYSASQSVNSATTITVGAGGSRGIYPSTYSTNGSNSQFGSITASVGGGTSNVSAAASSGGSGGGGNEGFNGGAGTSGQGNAGANGGAAGTLQGGGGGGAGAAGSSTTGGNGVSTYSSWATTTGTGANGGYYAGGGGGAPSGGAGLGGGGTGGGALDGGAGTANTGGGGGGTGSSGNGGVGGSGIVIVRYAV